MGKHIVSRRGGLCGLVDEAVAGGNIEMIAYNTHEETEAFMAGYVWGHRKGCLSCYEKCLKMLDDEPEEFRTMLRSEISRLCQEIEDNKK